MLPSSKDRVKHVIAAVNMSDSGQSRLVVVVDHNKIHPAILDQILRAQSIAYDRRDQPRELEVENDGFEDGEFLPPPPPAEAPQHTAEAVSLAGPKGVQLANEEREAERLLRETLRSEDQYRNVRSRRNTPCLSGIRSHVAALSTSSASIGDARDAFNDRSGESAPAAERSFGEALMARPRSDPDPADEHRRVRLRMEGAAHEQRGVLREAAAREVPICGQASRWSERDGGLWGLEVVLGKQLVTLENAKEAFRGVRSEQASVHTALEGAEGKAEEDERRLASWKRLADAVIDTMDGKKELEVRDESGRTKRLVGKELELAFEWNKIVAAVEAFQIHIKRPGGWKGVYL
ncbi:hypothetical protein KFL_012620010 [Klebsormidium nitens]|uniref:Uncharacterized protein n=1 Tax=Klebsormidium nitens TaxID=105231 RepID=A0A1Y1IUJ1_KLENI|nr:hypothetical protein KFL_012620010 [Klebsormidium nitens]|eukprot:GAQ93031.1 hypothetical protein KFL_012620010 [Klebsormidium nitens]